MEETKFQGWQNNTLFGAFPFFGIGKGKVLGNTRFIPHPTTFDRSQPPS
jgi:hypothetical protein